MKGREEAKSARAAREPLLNANDLYFEGPGGGDGGGMMRTDSLERGLWGGEESYARMREKFEKKGAPEPEFGKNIEGGEVVPGDGVGDILGMGTPDSESDGGGDLLMEVREGIGPDSAGNIIIDL